MPTASWETLSPLIVVIIGIVLFIAALVFLGFIAKLVAKTILVLLDILAVFILADVVQSLGHGPVRGIAWGFAQTLRVLLTPFLPRPFLDSSILGVETPVLLVTVFSLLVL